MQPIRLDAAKEISHTFLQKSSCETVLFEIQNFIVAVLNECGVLFRLIGMACMAPMIQDPCKPWGSETTNHK